MRGTAYILEREEGEETGSGCLLPHAKYSGKQERWVVENSTLQSGHNALICNIVNWTVDATSPGSVL